MVIVCSARSDLDALVLDGCGWVPADEHADEPAAARRRLELGSAAVTSPYFGSAPSGAATAPGSSVTAPWELSDDDDESAAGSARAHS